MIEYKLAPYHMMIEQGETGYFGVGSVQRFICDHELWRALVLGCHLFLNPNSIEKISNILRKEFSEKTVKDAIAVLKDGALIRADVEYSFNRYGRHLLYYNMYSSDPAGVQRKISQSKIAILGCGGIGNHAALMLAGAGVSHLTLIDDDKIELSNLSRQILFREQDIGMEKIIVARDQLLARNSDCMIECLPMRIQKKEDFQKLAGHDLVLLSADSPVDILLMLNEFAVKQKLPYINAGYIGDIAVTGPFYIPSKTSCAACQDRQSKRISSQISTLVREINQQCRAASSPQVNTVAAGMAVSDILAFIGGYSYPLSAGCRVGFTTTSGKLEIHAIERNLNCEQCGQ